MWNLKTFELIYSRYESSGLKVRDFCANEVINEAKFNYWQKKFRESQLPAQRFVPLFWTLILPASPCLVRLKATLLIPFHLPWNMRFFILAESRCVSKAQ